MAGLCLIILIVYDQIQLIVDQITHYDSYQGFTALHLACWRGSVSVVRRLLNCTGGVSSARDSASDDLATDLTKSRNNSLLALLCFSGILTTLKSIGGHTPLVVAMEWRRELVAKVFPSPILCSNIISLNCSYIFVSIVFSQEILRYSKQKREGTAIVLEEPQSKQNNKQDFNQTTGQVNQVIAHLNKDTDIYNIFAQFVPFFRPCYDMMIQ